MVLFLVLIERWLAQRFLEHDKHICNGCKAVFYR